MERTVMKFRISRASEQRSRPPDIRDIDSIEQLIELSKSEGFDLVVSSEPLNGYPTIVIYDARLES